MAHLDESMTQPAPQVFPVRFDESAVVLGLRFWIENPTPQRKWRAVQAVVHGVKTKFGNEGIKIPFPQRELTRRQADRGFRVGDERVSEPVDKKSRRTSTELSE